MNTCNINYEECLPLPLDFSIYNFSKYSINCTWKTIYVGRKLRFLIKKQLESYAVAYLLSNAECINPNIAEIAYNAATIHDIDNLLANILRDLQYDLLHANDPLWRHEKRKWRYCLMQSMLNSTEDVDVISETIDSIYIIFNHPDDLAEYTYYRERYKYSLYRKEQKTGEAHSNFLKEFKSFVENERIIILNAEPK